jgi:hypothetical protein
MKTQFNDEELVSGNINSKLLFDSLTTEEMNQFYAITLYPDRIVMQGNYNSYIPRQWVSQGFKFEIDSNGFVAGCKNCVTIILT